jgi:hypothetical protein
VSRFEVSATQIGRFAYILGGIPKGSALPVGTLERYDLATGRAVLLRSLPVGVVHVGLVAYKGDLVAVGGNPTETSAIADVYRYDTSSNTWSKLTALPGGPRGGAAVGVLGDRLFVAGGASASGTLRTLDIYDLARKRWSRGADLPTPRTHLGGAVVRGGFYAVGGTPVTGPGADNLAVVERYDPSANRWQKMPDLPHRHWGFGITRVAGRIAVVGGAGAGGLVLGLGGLAPQVDLFDPVRRRWSTLPGLRTPRHHLAAVAMGDRIYAIGGTTTLVAPTTTAAVERLKIPHPDRSRTLVDFKASVRGARVAESGSRVTTAGQMRSRVLGDGAVVSQGTAAPEATTARWSIMTPDGALYARVLLFTHLGPAGVALDGIGTITGGTARYRGATGWFAADESLSGDFTRAAAELEGTVLRPR